MRPSLEQTLSIRHAVLALAGMDAEVALFGSRLDDAARGGDVDLFVETDARLSLLDRARIKMELEYLLGLPVDIVARTRGESSTPFQNIAQAGGEAGRRCMRMGSLEQERVHLATYQYETGYDMIAEHFTTLHTLIPGIYGAAVRFVAHCRSTRGDFSDDLEVIVQRQRK